MQIIFLGICILGLGIQALLLRNKSKEPNFKPFTEDYKNRLAKFPLFLIIGILAIGSGLLAVGIKGKIPSNENSSNVDTYSSPKEVTTPSSTTNSNKKTRTVYSGGFPVEIDMTIPNGYEEGFTCNDCDGEGVVHDNGMGKKMDMICPGCAGRGFQLRKKRNY